MQYFGTMCAEPLYATIFFKLGCPFIEATLWKPCRDDIGGNGQEQVSLLEQIIFEKGGRENDEAALEIEISGPDISCGHVGH